MVSFILTYAPCDYQTNKDFNVIVDPELLKTVIRAGCEAAIAAEPNLTKWDMVMGDGDCGEAVEGVSKCKAQYLNLT